MIDRKGAQHHGVDEAENRGVRADAQRQSENGEVVNPGLLRSTRRA